MVRSCSPKSPAPRPRTAERSARRRLKAGRRRPGQAHPREPWRRGSVAPRAGDGLSGPAPCSERRPLQRFGGSGGLGRGPGSPPPSLRPPRRLPPWRGVRAAALASAAAFAVAAAAAAVSPYRRLDGPGLRCGLFFGCRTRLGRALLGFAVSTPVLLQGLTHIEPDIDDGVSSVGAVADRPNKRLGRLRLLDGLGYAGDVRGRVSMR